MIRTIDHIQLDYDALFEWLRATQPRQVSDVHDPRMGFAAPFRTEREQRTVPHYPEAITTFDVWRPEVHRWVPREFWARHGLDSERSWCRVVRHAPAQFLPAHVDICPGAPALGFEATRDEIMRHNEQAVRLSVPLEDSDMAHIFYGDGWALNQWRRGDVLSWDTHEPHGFVNAGITDRWTMLLSAYYLADRSRPDV